MVQLVVTKLDITGSEGPAGERAKRERTEKAGSILAGGMKQVSKSNMAASLLNYF